MKSRVEIIEDGRFDPHTWLRREVLWAYMMSPYGQQMQGFINGTASDQYAGNLTRQKIYENEPDAEAQSMAFFNEGKKVAGLTSAAIVFKAFMDNPRPGAYVNLYELQNSMVKKVLEGKARSSLTDEIAHLDASSMARIFDRFGRGDPKAENALATGSEVMATFASAQAADWVEKSEDGPTLQIHDGGYPRSGGPRVEKLQPIFHKIVTSEAFIKAGE